MKGTAATGKTSWALSQFQRPHLIAQEDDLKSLQPNCDGLVFDELMFGHLAKKDMISQIVTELTIWKEEISKSIL